MHQPAGAGDPGDPLPVADLPLADVDHSDVELPEPAAMGSYLGAPVDDYGGLEAETETGSEQAVDYPPLGLDGSAAAHEPPVKEVSDALRNFLGCEKHVCPSVVTRAVLDYIAENNLQNPSDEQISCDDRMRMVFGVDSFTIMSMNKYLSAHIEPYPPVEGESMLAHAVNTSTHSQISWDTRFDELQGYKLTHGDWPTLGSGPLGRWMGKQRELMKKRILSEYRISRLNEIGMTWIARAPTRTWEHSFQELVAYKQAHAGKDPPLSVPQLGRWLGKNREAHRKGLLPAARQEQLVRLGCALPSAVAAGRAYTWDERCGELRAHLAAHGKEPTNTSLGRWVRKQRDLHRKGTLSFEKVDALTRIGFDWVGPHGNVAFDYSTKMDCIPEVNLDLTVSPGRLGITVQFDLHHGALITNINPKCTFKEKVEIGDRLILIDGQQVRKKEDLAVNSDRVRIFGFATRRGKKSVPQKTPHEMWMDLFGEFSMHRHKSGDTEAADDPRLEGWVKSQRSAYKLGKLSEEQIQLLENAGFTWSGKDGEQIVRI